MAPDVKLQLLKFESKNLDSDEDQLIKWLQEIGFWDIEVNLRVKAAANHLPLDIEGSFKDRFGLPMNSPTKKLFYDLLKSDIGLSLKLLGFCDGEWKDPETCVGKILSLKLGRVQDRERFKALNIAFDPRVQFLLGVRAVPYA
ncbi:MAG: hypothetical protein UV71_C0004G0004 [Microgenomates group bacterium GW2011_GWC1_43_13]|uniref:Uncharacterized protein n=2 Tax=Candidatus Woeseibacteriota TaxID=1752722 RepID=A0A1F8DI31_9BACT|nr:MAG: hypothetical protein UV71_C0004G0004 [Microgenomates group bacterium GW2011_GWC1_43_13]KKT32985.1 MAG: hypothetical protein UW20_C0006G0002 [Candidatus Woesebacteria bacterium GW2011_GWB1_44_11]OGM75918.1 MAG: hypothetical protein A2208_01365 [Candidatus Woesebacteria bacterium RIFOXYA1_FULL_43_16]OGM81449.1 MAG: hypothetical protein A2394_02935 [Candidatus Woesebacteria bacterium RIFOXYB1_FULL_42_36]OGM84022.1 MAG: hypothetical protein A2421_01750 [Candidatus Woesebacteria bacterium RI